LAGRQQALRRGSACWALQQQQQQQQLAAMGLAVLPASQIIRHLYRTCGGLGLQTRQGMCSLKYGFHYDCVIRHRMIMAFYCYVVEWV
jgi:hypothetical protein